MVAKGYEFAKLLHTGYTLTFDFRDISTLEIFDFNHNFPFNSNE